MDYCWTHNIHALCFIRMQTASNSLISRTLLQSELQPIKVTLGLHTAGVGGGIPPAHCMGRNAPLDLLGGEQSKNGLLAVVIHCV